MGCHPKDVQASFGHCPWVSSTAHLASHPTLKQAKGNFLFVLSLEPPDAQIPGTRYLPRYPIPSTFFAAFPLGSSQCMSFNSIITLTTMLIIIYLAGVLVTGGWWLVAGADVLAGVLAPSNNSIICCYTVMAASSAPFTNISSHNFTFVRAILQYSTTCIKSHWLLEFSLCMVL